MRSDSVGIFWQDAARGPRGSNKSSRPMPPIPDTGWEPPSELPNLAAARAIAIDVETYDPELEEHGPGWARGKGEICGLAVGTEDGGRWYFPIRHRVQKEKNLDPDRVLAWAKDTLKDPRQPKIGANLTYDVGWLREEGIRVEGRLYDVQYAEALLRETGRVSLDTLASQYLGEHKTSEVLYDWCAAFYGGKMNDKQRANIYRAPPTLVGPYAEGDVDLPFRVLEKQWPRLAQQGLLDIFDMECRLIPLMIEMRYAGVTIDVGQAERMRDRLIGEINILHKKLEALVGFEVNINANESVGQAFDSLGLYYSRTATGKPSFTKAFLKTVDHPIGDIIRKIREREKIKGTFIESYLLNSHVDGKVYGQFHQMRGDSEGTRSGRFSSSTPNLQNIPIRSDLGKELRKCFVPDPGHLRWRKHDYSQIEYRGLAHYAVGPGADDVRAQYNADPNTDFHKLVQELILRITGQELERPLVKNINFGTVYGMGKPGLARYLKLALRVAERLFEAIHEGAPFLKATMDATIEEADELGYITTIMGRRSRFELWVPGKWDEAAKPLPYERAILKYQDPRRAYLHKALNRRLQGSAADLMKMAMLRCWEDGIFDATGVPRLTVHDELDFSDPGGRDNAFREMIHVMETAIPFRVPVMVGNEIGPSWGEVQEVPIT